MIIREKRGRVYAGKHATPIVLGGAIEASTWPM